MKHAPGGLEERPRESCPISVRLEKYKSWMVLLAVTQFSSGQDL